MYVLDCEKDDESLLLFPVVRRNEIGIVGNHVEEFVM